MEDLQSLLRERSVGANSRNAGDRSANEGHAATSEAEDDQGESGVHIPALNERYESLDYDLIENQLYKKEVMSAKHQLTLWRMSVNRWVVCFMIGIVTALIACAVDIYVSYMSALKFRTLRDLFDSCSRNSCMYVPLLVWVGWNVGLVFVASSLILFVSGPVASGSGIPQVKCFLNGVQVPGVVRLKTLIVKVVSVACSVTGGLAVGKEGPMIHAGAAVAAGVSQGRCISLPLDCKMFEYFRSDREKRDFVCAGAAAGVAAAFGAPIGGVLFSLEEASSFWNQSLTWRIFFSSMITSCVLSIVLSAFNGKPGALSWSGLANFGTFSDVDYNIWEVVFYLLMGVFGGLSGALFNHISFKLTTFRLHFVRKKWLKLFEALLVAAVSAIASFLCIFSIDDCQPLFSHRNITQPLQLWCPDGQFSAVAELFFQTPEEGVKSFFHARPNSFSPSTIAIFAVLYYLLSAWTYGISVSSGLFIPALLTGAAWGRLVGIGVEALFPDVTGLDPGKYALAGAAAQLGGVVRMTISLCAILIEATRDITFGLPIMIILMMAKWVGDYFNEGVYDLHIELSEVPVLGWDPPVLSSNIPAVQVMCPRVVVVRQIEKVGRLYQILRETRHHGFPVVDDYDPDESSQEVPIKYGRLQGLVMRYQLITLIQHKMFSEEPGGANLVAGPAVVKLRDFRDAYPRYRVALEWMIAYGALVLQHVSLTPAEKECWLDLRPFMNPSPYRVSQEASMRSVYRLFRGLGLRHLMVVDHDSRIVGIVTRKDLARFKGTSRKDGYLVKERYITVGGD